MPVQVSYPGVYIQEVSSGVHTITGVATSIAAFIGRASKGKMNKATRVQSLADYTRAFGQPFPGSDLATAVRLFFANGGSDCYVIRVAKNALAATVTLKSYAGDKVLVATAKSEGLWGNFVRMEVDYNTPSPDDTFNLRLIQEENGNPVATEAFTGLTMNPASPRYAPSFVTQSSELINLDLSSTITGSITNVASSFRAFTQARRSFGADGPAAKVILDGLINPGGLNPVPLTKFEISVNDSQFVPINLAPWAAIPNTLTGAGSIAEGFKTRINNTLALLDPTLKVDVTFDNIASVGQVLTITSDTSPYTNVKIRSASQSDIAGPLMLGVDQGGVEPSRWSYFRPAATGTLFGFGNGTGTAHLLTNLDTLAPIHQDVITKITIDGVDVNVNLVTVAPGNAHNWNESNGTAINANSDGMREKLRIIASAINTAVGLPWRAEVWGTHLVILARTGPVNQQPTTITVTTATAAFTTPLVKNVRQYTLGVGGVGPAMPFAADGADGSEGIAPTETEYIGNQLDQTGFYALDPVDMFNLMVIPADFEVPEATHLNLWGPASDYCAAHRAMLLIDAPASWTTAQGRPKVVQDTSKVDNDIRKKVTKINSAVFYPRIVINEAGILRTMGPAGAMAGLMARTDSARGVWKAPAGIEADLRGLVGLEVNLTDMENGVLNKIGVNCIRSFPSGFTSWGARTLDGSDDFGSEWKYIPIRRLTLFLEESLFRGTKWVVFEPNDEPLWAKIRLNLNAFMMSLFRQGAFQGTTPDKAFFVKCDAETTTQNDRNLGIVNIEVGFAPLKPAEFVVIKIQQIAGDL